MFVRGERIAPHDLIEYDVCIYYVIFMIAFFRVRSQMNETTYSYYIYNIKLTEHEGSSRT